jgi:hypothetical protein
MERDLDLYREILLAVEELHTPGEGAIRIDRDDGWKMVDQSQEDLRLSPPPGLEGVELPVVLRHVELLSEAGLLKIPSEGAARVGRSKQLHRITVYGITHEGHDFLDNVRDDTVWNRTKEKTGQASLEIVKAVAEGVVKSMVGL